MVRGGGGGLWLYFVYWGCASLKGMFFTISVWEVRDPVLFSAQQSDKGCVLILL